MVDMTAPHKGDYVRHDELPEHVRMHVIITSAGVELVGQDQRPASVVGLARSSDGERWPRKAIMNKTNTTLLAAAYGKDSAGWIGKPMTIWNDPDVMFKAEKTGGFKVAAGHVAQPGVAGAIPVNTPVPGAAATSGNGAIPLPGPVQSAPASGNGAADPVTAGTAVNMGGRDVPLPSGMPSAAADAEDEDRIPL